MDIGLLLLFAFPFLVIIWIILMYNALARLRQQCREAWSNVDAELKRRYDLVPNLVETVEGYAQHERETLEAVIQARNQAAASNGPIAVQMHDESALVNSLRSLFIVVEKYPELKASDHFLLLQQELANTEDRIQAARRFFNGNVRDYNTRIEVFPSSLVAMVGGFHPEDFFEVEEAVMRSAPRVRI